MVPTAKLCKLPVACVMGLLVVLCGCQGLVNGSRGFGNIQAGNHIIFMVQENRSFDTYFGQLPAYWQANGFQPNNFMDCQRMLPNRVTTERVWCLRST